MATQLPISTDEIAIRYRQPYVSEALNRKAAAEPGGIRKGFRLSLDGAPNNSILLKTDEQAGLSVMNITNSSDPEFTVTWLRTEDTIVAVPQAASWFHLFVNHGYVFNQETAPTLTWYTSAEVLDGAIANPGLYICSAFGVVSGAPVTQARTSFSLSDGTLLKRATASNASGARTRVRGYDEEPVFYTDFNGRSMTPIDLNADRVGRLTARVVTSKETTQLPVVNGALNLLSNYQPESNDSMLLIWRRDVDTTNYGAPAGTLTQKRYALPAHIPLRSVDTTDTPSTVRLFVRYAAFREVMARGAGSPEWQIGLQLATSRESRVTPTTVVGINLETIKATDLALTQATLDHTGAGQWRWAAIEAVLPIEDSTGPINIIGASVIINIPDMRPDESIAIDRILVESDVAPLTEVADGYQSLMSNAIGRFSSYDLDAPVDTVITPSKRGLAVHPAGDILTHPGERAMYAVERAAHETMIGLPVRDDAHLGRLEVGGEDFSIIGSSNNAVDYGNLTNLFKQSSLVVNAPGMYNTSALIAALEANGSTVPEGLRAPQKAGITINNGNLIVRRAEGSIGVNLATSTSAPPHRTGAVFADAVYALREPMYGALDTDGVFVEGQSPQFYLPMSRAQVSARHDVTPVAYATHPTMGEVSVSAVSLKTLLTAPSITTVPAEWDQNAYDNAELVKYNSHRFGLAISDGAQVVVTHDIASGLPTDVKASLFVGLNEPIRASYVGATNLGSIRVTPHTKTGSAFYMGNATSYVADINSDELLLNGADIAFDDTDAPNYDGAPLIFTTVALQKPHTWSNGFLSAPSRRDLRTQRLNASETASISFGNSLASILPSNLNLTGSGVEVRRSIRVDAAQGLKQASAHAPFGAIKVNPSASVAVLEMSSVTADSIPLDGSMTDLDERTDRMLTHLLHYLQPRKADGSVYGFAEAVLPDSVFRFQVLRDPDSYAGYVASPEDAWYSDPSIEFAHEVMVIKENLAPSARAIGIKRHSLYEFFANLMGFATGFGSTFAPAFPAAPNALTRTDVLTQMISALQRVQPIPFAGLLYTAGDADGLEHTTYGMSAAALQALIAAEIGEPDYDLFTVRDDQRQVLSLSICYDNSFAATSLTLHPVTMTPVVYDILTACTTVYMNS